MQLLQTKYFNLNRDHLKYYLELLGKLVRDKEALLLLLLLLSPWQSFAVIAIY